MELKDVVQQSIAEVLEQFRSDFESLNKGLERIRKDIEASAAPQNRDEKEVYRETARLLDAVARGDTGTMYRLVEEYQKRGYYETRDGFSTADSAPLLPTLVADRIISLFPQYGVAARLADTFRMSTDTLKIPYTSAELTAFAVNEESEIKSSKLAFQSVTISPKKWGLIAPWTSETEEEARVQYTQKVVERAAAAFAKAMDEVMFIANGSAAYHNYTGLLNLSGVNIYTLPSGKTNYADVTVDDLIKAQQLFPEEVDLQLTGVYSRSVDIQLSLAKDGSGRYIFDPAGMVDDGTRGRIRRKVIGDAVFLTSPVMPSTLETTQNGKPFCVIGDFRYYMIGIRRDISVTTLTEAVIKSVDNTTTINLATQDSRALRFTARWAFVTPPGPALRAFTVVKTAAA